MILFCEKKMLFIMIIKFINLLQQVISFKHLVVQVAVLFLQAASAFEKNLIDSSKEQKKRHDKESKQVKYDDPESTYKTPNIEDLRRKREELLQKIKSKINFDLFLFFCFSHW